MKVNNDVSKSRREVKIKTTKANITSRSGLLLFDELIHRIGAASVLDECLCVKKRQRGFTESEFIIPFALALLDGASCLDDIKRLREDEETCDLLQMEKLPHATTLGDFLRRFHIGNIYQFNKAHRKIAEKFHQVDFPETVGVDLDSLVTEKHGHQQGVDRAYNGKKGYHPQFAFRTDTKECIFAWLQRGSAYSARRAVFMLRAILKALPEKTKTVHLRADSAWYQLNFLRACEDCKEREQKGVSIRGETQRHEPRQRAAGYGVCKVSLSRGCDQ